MKTNAGRFSLNCTALKLWPSNHKQAWEKSLKAPGLFERPSSPAKWRSSSIIKTRKGYGIWLDWLTSASGYSASEISKSRCEDLVTQETVIAYVDYLERFCSSMTVYNRVQELYDANHRENGRAFRESAVGLAMKRFPKACPSSAPP